MIKLDINEADKILDTLGSNEDPVESFGIKTNVNALSINTVCAEEPYAHKIKISYYGGKVLRKKHGTVTEMIVDRLVNNRLTKENALEILDRLIGGELIVFKNKLIYLDGLLKASKAKWADKVCIKWQNDIVGKKRRRGTLTDMVYDILQITHKERKKASK